MRSTDPRRRGLPSLNEAREERKRRLVTGKARVYAGAPQFWAWTGLLFVAFGIIYWKIAQGELESAKSAVMAKQRAIAETLGPSIFPFRDKIEAWVQELATTKDFPRVAGDLTLERLQNEAGVYLRLQLKQAGSVEEIREAATRSLRDGFTSCLFVSKKGEPGEACTRLADCPPGKLCSDWGHCEPPSQPYNMRLAYRALRVLTSDWTDELHQAGTDLAVRAFELDLEAVTKNDVPIAAELLARARLFTVVLDEEPVGGIPPPVEHEGADGSEAEEESEEERLHRTAHPARIGIWDLRTGENLLALRARADGQFVPVGDQRIVSARNLAAQKRQVNSCALALAVKEALPLERRRKEGADAGTAP